MEILLRRRQEPGEAMPGSANMRIHTLFGVLLTIGRFVIFASLILMGISTMGINVGPILAGAGIAGLAVGLGAQNLLRDVISGFFIILEDQIRVGDLAIVNGTEGEVETITFRTIVLRDLAGVVHVFPNGSITTLANMTKTWSAYVIDIGVAYKEDTDRVVEIMCAVGDDMRRDPLFGKKMIEPIEMLGVDRFGESEVIIKARLKTVPMEQANVGREYRRRIKKAFDLHGIEFPVLRRAINVVETTKSVGTEPPPSDITPLEGGK
jgi:small conductance mechanosensitive channel